MANSDAGRPSKRVKTSDAPLKSILKKTSSSADPVKETERTTKTLSVKSQVPDKTVHSKFSKKVPKQKKNVERDVSPPLIPKTKSNPKANLKGKAKAEPSSADGASASSYPQTFKVVAGTYEKLLYGLEGTFFTEDNSLSLKPLFIFPAHIGCVKAVAASPGGGKWLATGSVDEIVKVWDLRRRKEVGGLIQHEGSITHLSFPTRSHLISASEDGTICIFRARDWSLLRSMKGHKGRVNSVAVHPSSKIALSVGKDRTLRMWDLMRGKGSASTKLGKEGELVRWSTEGNRFVVQTGSTIDIYSTNMSLLHTLTHPSRIQDLRFYTSSDGTEYLLVAAEDKKVTFYSTDSEDSTSLPIIAVAVGHENRVKAIDILRVATPSNDKKSQETWTTILSTVSSDGFIRIFDLGLLSPEGRDRVQELQSVALYDTKASRLTCCTLGDGEAQTSGMTRKRKHIESEDEDDGDKGEVNKGVLDGEEEEWGGLESENDESS